MNDIAKFSAWLTKDFDGEDRQYQLDRFRLALKKRKRETNSRKEAEFIEFVSGYIEDPGFWQAIDYLNHLKLPE